MSISFKPIATVERINYQSSEEAFSPGKMTLLECSECKAITADVLEHERWHRRGEPVPAVVGDPDDGGVGDWMP